MDKCTLTNIELINRVEQELNKLIETGGKSFTMRVPAQVNNDTDLIISELLTRFKISVKAALIISDVKHRSLEILAEACKVDVEILNKNIKLDDAVLKLKYCREAIEKALIQTCT